MLSTLWKSENFYYKYKTIKHKYYSRTSAVHRWPEIPTVAYRTRHMCATSAKVNYISTFSMKAYRIYIYSRAIYMKHILVSSFAELFKFDTDCTPPNSTLIHINPQQPCMTSAARIECRLCHYGLHNLCEQRFVI